jgi:hypothetical protein
LAADLGLLKPDTCSAARLAQNFRYLIHPGRAAAHSAVGALLHAVFAPSGTDADHQQLNGARHDGICAGATKG